MDTENIGFWGIALKAGEPMDVELKMGETLHITMASFGPQLKDPKGRSVVTVKVGEEDKWFSFCALNAGGSESTVMDMQFVGEEKMSFRVSGKNEVHLVGNFHFDGMSDDEAEEDDLIDVYDDGALGEQSDDSEDVEAPTLMIEDDPPVITEVKDEEEAPKERVEKPSGRKGKKGKKNKGSSEANGSTKENKSVPDTKAENVVSAEKIEKTAKPENGVKKGGKKTPVKSDEKATPGKRKNANSEASPTPAKKVKKASGDATPEKKSAKKADKEEVAKTPKKTPEANKAAEKSAEKSASKSAKKRSRRNKGKKPEATA